MTVSQTSFYNHGFIDSDRFRGEFATTNLPSSAIPGDTAFDTTTGEYKRYQITGFTIVNGSPSVTFGWVARGGDVIGTTAGEVLAGRSSSDPRTFIPYANTDGGSSDAAETARQGAYDVIYQSVVDNIEPDVAFSAAKSGDFINFHTVNQAQYIEQFRDGTPKAVYFNAAGDRISKSSATNSPSSVALTALLGADGKTVYILEQLQKGDIAQMPLADQQSLAALANFDEVASPLGLSSSKSVAIAGIENAINNHRTARGLSSDSTNPQFAGLENAEHRAYFNDQIVNLKAQLDTMAVFSLVDIVKQVKEIGARWERAYEFNKGRTGEGKFGATNHPTNIREVNVGGIANGYASFIEQERVIRDISNQRFQLANNRTVSLPTSDGQAAVQRKLDAPMLIMLFQQYMNLTVESEVAAETEEVRQQNLLLADYNRMQNIVNATLKLYDDTGDDAAEEKHTVDANPSPSASPGTANNRAIAMFDDELVTDGGKHPLEVLRNIPRPLNNTLEIPFGEKSLLKTQWEAFGTQLSDAVSLINQNTQIKMNDINSANRQKNRHFDLANNALRKMADTVQSIARAI